MGRRPKTPAEVEEIKNKILDAALQLIGKEGYGGFSIRKLGPMLGIAPKTIYNYFESKDEIYLHVLIKGFELLYQKLSQSVGLKKDSLKKLSALAKTHIRFGIENANYYDLMFTWHVPKFNDFIGTDLEPLAFAELQSGLKTFDLLLKVIEQIATEYGSIKKNDARKTAIQFFASLHGMVALRNNTILSYIHEDPDTLMDSLITGILEPLASLKAKKS